MNPPGTAIPSQIIVETLVSMMEVDRYLADASSVRIPLDAEKLAVQIVLLEATPGRRIYMVVVAADDAHPNTKMYVLRETENESWAPQEITDIANNGLVIFSTPDSNGHCLGISLGH